MRSAVIITCLALTAGLAACGSDTKKVRSSCVGDATCDGGVCFEQQCYDACAETIPCADDEVCVRRERGGAEVDVCVVAADFEAEQPACVNAQPDCDVLVRGVCQIVGCHSGACVVEPKTDGIDCRMADESAGSCKAGVCEARTVEPPACDGPAGTWSGTFTRPDGTDAPCVIDGQVTQTSTCVFTKNADGSWSETGSTTNMPDGSTGTCVTMEENYPIVTYDPATGALSMLREFADEKNCEQPKGVVSYTMRFGYDGVLSADCTTIVGVGWIEPKDICYDDTSRMNVPLTLTRVTAARAAY